MGRHRLLIISSEYPPGPGGIGNQTFSLAQYFWDGGYQVKIFAPSRSEFENAFYDSQSSWQVLRYSPDLSSFSKLLGALRILTKQPRNTRIILSGSAHVLLAILIRMLGFSKVMIILHGSELGGMSFLRKNIFSLALSCAQRVVTVSEFTRKLAAKINKRVKAHVIPNGVAIQSFKISGYPKRIPGKPLRLITVGSITPRKGQLNVVNALPRLLDHFPELEYHIIGINRQEKELNKVLNQLGVQSFVFVHGPVPDDDKWRLLQSADIFMMLSNNLDDGDVEGFGIAVLEGNAFGLPAIGSSQTGIEQAIADFRTGRLVKPTDTEMILEAINDITQAYSSYSAEAVKWAKEHDWSIIGRKYLELIEE